MPGVVSTLAVSAGQAVKAGDVLLSIEAMKMETALHAERDGKIAEVLVTAGDQIDAKDLLVVYGSRRLAREKRTARAAMGGADGEPGEAPAVSPASRVERDVDRAERLRDRAFGLCLLGEFLELGRVDARHLADHGQRRLGDAFADQRDDRLASRLAGVPFSARKCENCMA